MNTKYLENSFGLSPSHIKSPNHAHASAYTFTHTHTRAHKHTHDEVGGLVTADLWNSFLFLSGSSMLGIQTKVTSSWDVFTRRMCLPEGCVYRKDVFTLS